MARRPQCPGVVRLVRSGDEPTHVPDEVIGAIRRNGAIDLPLKHGAHGRRLKQLHMPDGSPGPKLNLGKFFE